MSADRYRDCPLCGGRSTLREDWELSAPGDGLPGDARELFVGYLALCRACDAEARREHTLVMPVPTRPLRLGVDV